MNTNLIADDVVEVFEADGVVVLRDVFTPWVEGVRQAIEENKRNPSWRERTYRPEEGEGCEFFSGLLRLGRFFRLSRVGG